MQDQDISPFPEGTPTRGIYVADGYGVSVNVRSKHLVVTDGIGSHRRERRFHKATSGLRRLVVLGHTGYVTFEALRWMTDAKVGYLQLDRDGTILATTGALGINKAELRRAQALAMGNKVGVEFTRSILGLKIEGQANLSRRYSIDAANQILRRIDELEGDADLDSLRLTEAQAARVYWDLWTELPVRFVRTDESKVPDHWKTFGTRGSPYGSRARLAANPANALLNYLYALLEAETTLACQAAGLDPGLGVLHTDKRFRASMALDLMEAVRPDVDAYLFDLVQGHVFRAGDFRETRAGAPISDLCCATCRTAVRCAPIRSDATSIA
jgi:CRISPR-associated endonuclease Cas1